LFIFFPHLKNSVLGTEFLRHLNLALNAAIPDSCISKEQTSSLDPRPAHLFISNMLKGTPCFAAGFWKAGTSGMADVIV
jgi:hypothetical protein